MKLTVAIEVCCALVLLLFGLGDGKNPCDNVTASTNVASMNLYTIRRDQFWSDDINYENSYAVQFLPFYVFEGGTVAYGIKLETEPTHNVTIQVDVNLLSGQEIILEPPTLVTNPSYLTFNSSNWNTHQKIMLTLIDDDIHHNEERFEVRHYVSSNDEVFQNKTNNTLLVVVDAADDDEVGIELEKTETITLEAGCSITNCPVARTKSP
jgi:hypothetical protein